MHREKVTVIALYTLVLSIFVANIFLRDNTKSKDLFLPFGNKVSFLTNHKEFKPHKYNVYGYLPYWALEDSQHLQLDKLTHIAYFGININKDGSLRKKAEDGNLDPGYNNWKNSAILNNIILEAKKYKIRVALTIISHQDDISDAFLDCRSCWQKLAEETYQEMKSKDIQDLNLNFEYAGYVDPSTATKYTAFVDFMNRYMDSRFDDSFVVVAAYADSAENPRVTNIQELAHATDAIFIMAYDFHQTESATTGPVAPIIDLRYDLTQMIKDYTTATTANKLIMGVPYYGYNWVIEEESKRARRKPGNDDIGVSQSQTYQNIMETILKVQPQIQWDDSGQAPYFFYTSPANNSLRQVFYENKDSLRIKYRLVKDNGFAGVGIWALGYDGGYTDLWTLLDEEF